VYTPAEDGKRKFYILPCSEFEDNPEFFRQSADYDAMIRFVKDARRLLNTSNTGFGEIINARDMWVRMFR